MTEIKGLDLNSYFRHTPLACSSVTSPGTYYPTAQPNYGMKTVLITVYGTCVIATWWFRVSKFEFANEVLPYPLVASLRYIGKTVCCRSLSVKVWNFSGIGTMSGINSQSETLPVWCPHSVGCICLIRTLIPKQFTPV